MLVCNEKFATLKTPIDNCIEQAGYPSKSVRLVIAE